MSSRRRFARTALVATALLGLVGLGAGTASAHVKASSPDAQPGGYGRVVFTVPNESQDASTVRVRIQVPQSTPLSFVSVRPVPGWNVTTTTSHLATPLKTDDGDTITDVVSVIDYTATDGGIKPGQFQEFAISGGPLPKSGTMVFPVVQSYSDGKEVAWIDPPADGQAEPEHPAPVLRLSAAGSAAGDAGQGSRPATTSSDGFPYAIAALAVAVVALVAGVTAVVLGRRPPRRTVSS